MKNTEMELLKRQEVGKRMRNLRGEKSLNDVAQALGVTAMAVSNWERGIRTPSDYMKVKIAQYYGVTVESIFFPSEVLI